MKTEALEGKICEIDAFAASPHTRDLLRVLLSDDESDVCELATAIERDLALSTQLLRLANSAYFGFSRSVATVHEAVMIMGMRNVSDLVSSLAVASNAQQFSGHGLIDFHELWSHASASAEAARLVARATQGHSELAYTAGLLHDVGMLALATVIPKKYSGILAHSKEAGVRLIDAECEILGVDHQWAGALLLAHWDFPEAVVEAAAVHHDPPADAGPLAMVVSAANVLATAEGLQEPHETIDIPGFTEVVRAALSISNEMFDDLVAQTHDRREAIELIAGEALSASR